MFYVIWRAQRLCAFVKNFPICFALLYHSPAPTFAESFQNELAMLVGPRFADDKQQRRRGNGARCRRQFHGRRNNARHNRKLTSAVCSLHCLQRVEFIARCSVTCLGLYRLSPTHKHGAATITCRVEIARESVPNFISETAISILVISKHGRRHYRTWGDMTPTFRRRGDRGDIIWE